MSEAAALLEGWEVFDRLKLIEFLPPIDWIGQQINLSRDPSSDGEGLIVLDPYQVEPIEAQFDRHCRLVTIIAPEQTGKSTCWRLALVYRMLFMPGPAWVIFEADDKAEDINATTLRPLLESIPEIERQLNRSTANKRRYQLSNGAIVDFCGAGADITSKTKVYGVADELDTWPLTNAKKRQNLLNFRKRFRVPFRKGRGCQVTVTSPKGEDSPGFDEFEQSSQGYYHLACLGCNSLSMRSCDFLNLQWERTDAGEVIGDSIRLICPKCGRQHEEPEAVEANAHGGYVHVVPEERFHRGFQWGALAAPRVFGWLDLARAQQVGGRSGELEQQMYLDNSLRGLRFQPRAMRKPELDTIRSHSSPPPDPGTLAAVMMGADTQNKGWFWTVAGFDCEKTMWVLGYGFAATDAELQSAWDARYLGILPVAGVIDEGGHRKDDVDAFIEGKVGLWKYKGNPRIGKDWKVNTEEDARRILANPHTYRFRVLHRLYGMDPGNAGGLRLPPAADLKPELVNQLCWHPDSKRKLGHRLENWVQRDPDDDHYSDCLKMTEVLFDLCRDKFRPEDWRIPVPWGQKKKKRRRRRK